jgi:uncharacterized membrane protein YhiD involved in acid resistance
VIDPGKSTKARADAAGRNDMSMIKPTIGETILAILTGGWGLVITHWRAALIVVVVVIVSIFGYCGVRKVLKPTPKLSEPEIHAAQVAIEEHNDAKLREILVNSDVREAHVDQDIYNARSAAVNAAAVSHEKYANMNTDELAAEIERRAQQP